jgi:Spy/CpxP family protein refolding chaperone
MKKLLLSLLLVGALPLAAQRGPGGPPPGGPPPQGGPGAGGSPPGQPAGPPPEQVLKDVLGLTDDQLAQIHALAQARGTATQALVTQMQAAQQALQTALTAATPDPTAVGNALLAIRNIEKQVEAAGDAFRAGVANVLTADQKAKVEQIKAIDAALHAAGALRGLGLI